MKRRARLRPRRALGVGDDSQERLGLDQRAARLLDGEGIPTMQHATLPRLISAQWWSAFLTVSSSPGAFAIRSRLDGEGDGDRRVVLALEGGIRVDPSVAAGAVLPTDHGRALRALRTARARRLAIALAMVRAARPE